MESFTQKSFNQDILSLAVLVAMPGKGYGSGVFILNENKVYFATARHVLFNQNKKLKRFNITPKSKKVQLHYYGINNNFDNVSQLEIDFHTLVESKKIKVHVGSDICVFQVGIIQGKDLKLLESVKLTKGEMNMNLANESMIRYFNDIEIGGDTFVIGYPKALGMKSNPQYNFNHPVVRKGIVAGKNSAKKTLLIDCPCSWRK